MKCFLGQFKAYKNLIIIRLLVYLTNKSFCLEGNSFRFKSH